MPDPDEFDYAMDTALEDTARLIEEIRLQLSFAELAVKKMRRQHTAGTPVLMGVNAGGVIQGLGSQLERQVGMLHVLVMAQRWRN